MRVNTVKEYNMSVDKLKYKLPNLVKLDFKFDLEILKLELSKLECLFKSVLESNGQFCANNHKLVQNVHDHFEQISLTTYKHQAEISLELCENTYYASNVKNRIRRQNIDPGLDERNYNLPISEYAGSYFEKVANSFASKPTRVRLTKLNAGKTIDPHIDYDPTYAVRIIIPIITDPQVINTFCRKNIYSEEHIPANGHAYFINTGITHSVINNSKIDRIALMISLDGTSDIDKYIIKS